MYQAEELKKRTKQFAIRIVKLFRSLPRSEEARIIGRQMLRSGTSVAQTIAPFAALAQKRNLSQKLAWWLKRPMKQYFGWNC